VTTTQVFRALVLLRFLIPFLSAAIAAIQFHASRFSPHEAHPKYVLAVASALAIGNIVITVGLWCFQRWARVALVVWLVIDITFALSFMPFHFFTPISWLEAYIVDMLAGAVIAMMFLPPVSAMFAKRKV